MKPVSEQNKSENNIDQQVDPNKTTKMVDITPVIESFYYDDYDFNRNFTIVLSTF
jgi:hypothetical protein